METLPKAAAAIVDIVDACTFLREDVTSKVFVDDLVSSLTAKIKDCLPLANEMDTEGIAEPRLSKLYNGAVPKSADGGGMFDSSPSWLGSLSKPAKAQQVILNEVPEASPEDRETLVDDVLDALKYSEGEQAARIAQEAEYEIQLKQEEDARKAGMMSLEGMYTSDVYHQ